MWRVGGLSATISSFEVEVEVKVEIEVEVGYRSISVDIS